MKNRKKENKLAHEDVPLSPSQTNYSSCSTIARETAEQKLRGSNQATCFCLHHILGIRMLPYLSCVQQITSSH